MLYLLLSIGALTTLYPFALMISTGLKGATDQADTHLIPKYLSDESELLNKYLNDKYVGDKFAVESNSIGGQASAIQVDQYRKFLEQLPSDYWIVGFRNAAGQVTSRIHVLYQNWLTHRFASIEALNRAYVEENVGFQTVSAPAELRDRLDWKPATGKRWDDWILFKTSLPAEFRIPIRNEYLFQKFLASQFKNQLGLVPPSIRGTAKSFAQIHMADGQSATDPESKKLWQSFQLKLPKPFRDRSVEQLWSEFSHSESTMPLLSFGVAQVQGNSSEIRREFAGRNFSYVLDYILLNGRAVWNTIIFCFLSILVQLTVNPIAAYALSRYPVKQSGKILIFLLATMAFPAEVAMIPSFLLLKDLGLLNTFAALVLPGAASGYMIFLLKGFFDSLPQELFEAGSIDGARETTMMFRIAFPLSRPVLGYLALLAFMGAYGAFIYAFLITQDHRLWTLMVWVYQLQSSGAPKATVMAALTITAIPTLLVFLCAQRVIMRGIVLPGER